MTRISKARAKQAAAAWRRASHNQQWPAIKVFPRLRGTGGDQSKRVVDLGYCSKGGFVEIVTLVFEADETPVHVSDRRDRKDRWLPEFNEATL